MAVLKNVIVFINFLKTTVKHPATYFLNPLQKTVVKPCMDPNNAFFKKDAWAKEAGIELIEVSAGRSKVRMKIEKRHVNSHDTVHGGAIFTLADTAFALASNSHGIPAAAINAHISYVKSAISGTLYAEGAESSLSPKIATYSVTVTDDNGEKIALFEGMVYRKSPRK